MNFSNIMKKAAPDLVAVLIFLAISIAYFFTPMSEGLILGGHDSVAAEGLKQEQVQYKQHHGGEVSRWSNAIFSGMPTYQTAPSYSATASLVVDRHRHGYHPGAGHYHEHSGCGVLQA